MRTAAPFLAELAQGPPSGHADWLTTADGVRLRMGLWPCAGARATVLLFPGRSEYIEKYGRAAVEFCARGYAVATLDWRGQGLSERLIDDPMTGHVFDFHDYQRDVAAFLEALDAADLPPRRYLVAHSMGAAIGLRALMEGLRVAAVAFSSPMWGIHMAAALKPLAWAMSWAWPKLGRGESYAPGRGPEGTADAVFEGNTLTRDRAMFDYMQAQVRALPGLALGGPSLQWLYQALSETRALRASRSRPVLPALAHVGTAERMVDVEAIEDVMASWPGAALTRVQGAEHEIMMELKPVRDAFFDSTAALFARAA